MLFNLVLESGVIPENWSIGYILPIYKNKGDRGNPNNYRGITLLSCVGKLFTTILNNHLNKFLNEYGTLGEEQAGFRSGYSTRDHIFAVGVLAKLYLSKGKKSVLCIYRL